MKKILCAILAVFMVMSMCGCAQLMEFLLEDDAQSEAVSDGPELSVGEINGNVYTNSFTGITYTAPESWAFASDEELAELMGVSADIVAGGDANIDEFAKLDSVYGMVAISPTESVNIQYVIENMENAGSERMTAKGYVKILALQVESLYAQEGAMCTVGEPSTVEIGGQQYDYIAIDVEMDGSKIEQVFACSKIDKYMSSIIISSGEVGEAMAQLECFS